MVDAQSYLSSYENQTTIDSKNIEKCTGSSGARDKVLITSLHIRRSGARCIFQILLFWNSTSFIVGSCFPIKNQISVRTLKSFRTHLTIHDKMLIPEYSYCCLHNNYVQQHLVINSVYIYIFSIDFEAWNFLANIYYAP